MAKYRAETGEYNLRVLILRRVAGAKQANGEVAESWPDPAVGTSEYFAARESLSAGETIVQGMRNSTGAMRLRIKGRGVAVAATDRVRVKKTGEVFEVTGVSRDAAETIVLVERTHGQTVGQ